MTPIWTAPGFKTYRPLPQPKRREWILLIAVAIMIASIAMALAQPSTQPFTPIDEELWNRTREAILQQSMPFAAHQAVLNIMQQIEQQAKQKAMMEKARRPEPKPLEEPK